MYPLTAVPAEARSCDYSHVANCADERTKARASAGNDGKHICQFVCWVKVQAN